MLDDGIRLFVPRQVKDEITRNRESKLKDALSSFEINNIKYPAFCKEYDEYVTLAYNRYRIGNPPGKDNKYGDAINWECLLNCVPDGEDLYFISSDKDYKSIMSNDDFNPFLREEWKENKGSEIVFYKNLISFLSEHIKNIKLKTEEEKEDLIDDLAESCNFMTTHGIIAMLKKHTGWTEEQIEKLCQIAEDNTQVAWILTDEDVYQFYKELIEKVDYDNTNDCATRRMIDNIQGVYSQDMPELADNIAIEYVDV